MLFYFRFPLEVDIWGERRLCKSAEWINAHWAKPHSGVDVFGLVKVNIPHGFKVSVLENSQKACARGPAEKPCYRGRLRLVHFKKAQTSLPFLFSARETERWRWGQHLPSVLPFFLFLPGLRPPFYYRPLCKAWIHFWNAKPLFGYIWQGKNTIKEAERGWLN